MKSITELMFWISNGLLVPVVLGLLFFFFKSLLQGGSFFTLWLYRGREERRALALLADVEREGVSALSGLSDDRPLTPFLETLAELHERRDDPAMISRVISEYELRVDGELGRVRLPAKFGPILGLMGTLIPMGPALVGLSTGDIGSMAYNMQIVFATTVLGLLTGAIGYVILQVRQRWLGFDLTRLDYVAEVVASKRQAP
ncbi:MAG: MotA/TolQ/ExbB proton channel family protein [Odoribacteraceae bacterium]|jgi:biopolymer transport protein ExbB/TolQ|nr:MotA/TolQ/ExbB proton channel family protein [Odoribacteraceae bacterium]